MNKLPYGMPLISSRFFSVVLAESLLYAGGSTLRKKIPFGELIQDLLGMANQKQRENERHHLNN